MLAVIVVRPNRNAKYRIHDARIVVIKIKRFIFSVVSGLSFVVAHMMTTGDLHDR
jgi:hypothetical protein